MTHHVINLATGVHYEAVAVYNRTMHTSQHTFSDVVKSGDPEHDPAGQAIQTHELPSGELLLTFDPEWARRQNWRVGDVLTMEINEEVGALNFKNPAADARQAELERLRLRVVELLDGGAEL